MNGNPRPGYALADDGLRGPVPVPRALRESLPPRSPGEVPRLAARRRLDAGEPCSAHGRVPARLLRPVADEVRVGRPLRLVPARRPGGVDLLRDLGAVGLAV